MDTTIKPILDRIEKQIYIMCGLPSTVLEENRKSALRALQQYEDKKYKEKWEDYFKCKYQCEWIELEDNTKWSKNTTINKNEMEELLMEQRLQELKDKITSFVIENDVKDFKVYISRGITIPTSVNLEIRV